MGVSEPGASRGPAVDGAGGWPVFAVLDRSTLPEEIASRLLELIRARRLRPGDKLPAERDLAAAMQVSRPVLREALRALAIMKVVEIRQGSGTYITALEPQQLVSHLDFVFSKDTVALAQVLEARRVLEVGNARLAAARIDAPRLAVLDGLLVELRSARRRCGPLQQPRHRLPQRRLRGGRQLPPGPVHEHHQHPGQGEPGADGCDARRP